MEGKTKTAEEIWNNTGFIDDYKITDIKNQLDFAVIQTMETYAKQEREKAVRDFKDKLINEISEGNSIDIYYVYYAELVELIEELK